MLVTALVTPFRDGGASLDLDGYGRLAAMQLQHGCDQVLVAGTTGEAASLDEHERTALLDAALAVAKPGQVMVAIGGGRLADVIARGRMALARGVRDLLLVDAPYSGASSTALREAWHAPVARALLDARLWPYAVPARTGTELLPDDLARLAEDCPNVVGVKDATGRLARMERVRALCGESFTILCGEDALLRDAMIDLHIRAQGGCAVTTNLAPAAMKGLHDAAAAGNAVRARELHDALTLLFGLMCVSVEERMVVHGEPVEVPQRFKNPVPVKAALAVLGVLPDAVRPPLATIGPNGLSRVRSALRLTARRHPEILQPHATSFGIDVAARLDTTVELARGAH